MTCEQLSHPGSSAVDFNGLFIYQRVGYDITLNVEANSCALLSRQASRKNSVAMKGPLRWMGLGSVPPTPFRHSAVVGTRLLRGLVHAKSITSPFFSQVEEHLYIHSDKYLLKTCQMPGTLLCTGPSTDELSWLLHSRGNGRQPASEQNRRTTSRAVLQRVSGAALRQRTA